MTDQLWNPSLITNVVNEAKRWAIRGKLNVSDMKCKGVVIHLNKLAYTLDCHFAEDTKGEIKFRFWREIIVRISRKTFNFVQADENAKFKQSLCAW